MPNSTRFPASDQRIPRLIVLISASLIVASVLMGTPLQSANDRSRWATVWSLVHRNTWQIDEIDSSPRWSTIDKVLHRADEDSPWHFYSSKPPLLSAIVAGMYAVERTLFGADLLTETISVTRSLLILLNAMPMAIALWLFQGTLARLNVTVVTQCFVLALVGIGSMLNPYLSTLNNHTPAAVCLLICLCLIVRLQQQTPHERRGRDFAMVGLTAALTSCFELPAALFGIITFVWMLCLDRRKTAAWYIPAAVIPLAAFSITNWMVTGGIRPFYAFYGTEKYIYTHNGVPSYWMNPQGLDANQESPLTYLLHCLIGHHGLLSHTPAFLLSLWGWMQWKRASRDARDGLKWVLPVGAGLSLVVLAFYMTRTQNYNYGGNSAALRWMLWVTPFWWFAMLAPLERLLTRTSGQVICGLLLATSIGTATVSMPTPWRPSWIFDAMTRAGWIDYSTAAAPFEPTRHSLIANWPEEPNTIGRWTLQSADDGAIEGRSIELLSLGHHLRNGQRVCPVVINASPEARGDAPDNDAGTVAVVLLDVFDAGQPVEEWLFVEEDGELSAPPKWLVNLVRGMPDDRAYAPAGVRWYQSSPDADGYRCERGAARVLVEDPQLGRCWHRCDVWYYDDIPFGVLRWKTTVTHEQSGELLLVRTWSAELSP